MAFCPVGEKANGFHVPVGPIHAIGQICNLASLSSEILHLFHEPAQIVEDDAVEKVLFEIQEHFGCSEWNELGKIAQYLTLLRTDGYYVLSPWEWDGTGYAGMGNEHDIKIQENLASGSLAVALGKYLKKSD